VHELLNSAPVVVKQSDVGLLSILLDVEYKAVAAYTAGVPLLAPDFVPVGKHFLDHEIGHAGGVYTLIRQAGGKGFRPAGSYPLGNPSTGEEVLTLLHQVEREQLAAYLYVIPRLSPSPVRAAVARYLAADAQHTAVLRTRLGLRSVPSAFVSGGE
jgi:hypothetical protein